MSFRKKHDEDTGWLNRGFFLKEPGVLDYIDGNAISLEQSTMENLVQKGQIAGYDHRGFWHAMDTLRDRNYLEQRWIMDQAPWKVWQ